MNTYKIKENLSNKTLSAVAENANDLQGVILQQETQRYCKSGILAPHVIGYVGQVDEAEVVLFSEKYAYGDMIGRTGIERSYDKYLRGKNGCIGIRVNAMGKELGIVYYYTFYYLLTQV